MKRITMLLLCGVAVGCGDTRIEQGDLVLEAAANYQDDISETLSAACVRCHGENKAEGDYRLDSWAALLGTGSDLVRNAIPGDATSKLVTVLDDQTHQGLLSDGQRSQLVAWVIDDKMAYLSRQNGYHGPGWLYPGDRSSDTFHGGWLRNRKWNMEGCKTCHGQDLNGSCGNCHAQGPTGCATCHGDSVKDTSYPPSDMRWGVDPASSRGVGLHKVHMEASGNFAPVACQSCHTVPQTWDAPGHLFDDEATKRVDFAAEVNMGAIAKTGGYAAFYTVDGSCSSYCHDPQNKGNKPSWLATASGSKCDSCHTLGHEDRGITDKNCLQCHKDGLEACNEGDKNCVKIADGIFLRYSDASKHINGVAALGDGKNTCYGCHGTQASGGAPAPDVNGRSDISNVSVGVHDTHAIASTRFAAIPCSECHKNYTSASDAGHLDSDLPAEVVFGDIATGKARGFDLKPTWDRATGTCSNIACHSLDGGAVGKDWKWTQRNGALCGTCHGLPPQKTAAGGAHSTNTNCQQCHGGAYKADGTLDPSKHINGRLFQ